MKRVIKYFYGCWKSSFKHKIGETNNFIQYYNVWTDSISTEKKRNS